MQNITEQFNSSYHSRSICTNYGGNTCCTNLNLTNISIVSGDEIHSLYEIGDDRQPFTRTALEIVWILIAVCGLSLNIAQIFRILTHHRKSVMDVFIVSLAVTDLQTCCFNIPFQTVELFYNFDWTVFGSQVQLACQFHWYFRHGSVVSGSIMISLIAISRYIAVSDPLRMFREKYSGACINTVLTILTWITTVALIAPVASLTASIHTKYVLQDSPNTQDSTSEEKMQNSSLECVKAVKVCEPETTDLEPIIIYGSALFFIVPLTILCVSYASLIRILIKRNHDMTYRGTSKHFVKSIVNSVLGLAYIILVAPKGIYDIIQISYTAEERKAHDCRLIHLVLYMIATMVVISNPLIYSSLTPRCLKFVEQHSHGRSSFQHHRSLFSVFSKANWGRRFSHTQSFSGVSRDKQYSRQETIKTMISDDVESSDITTSERAVATLLPTETVVNNTSPNLHGNITPASQKLIRQPALEL